MNRDTYNTYRDALEAAKDRHDDEAIEQIKSRVVEEHGLKDDDVEHLFLFHT